VFSSNGKSLASSSYDRTIRLWNYLETTSPPVLLTDNDKWVYGITFTPDQQKIISCGADKTLRVFQINPEVLSGRICGFVKRNLTESEWNKYIGNDIPYHKTCDKK
jgi:WD40 repeat protein